MESKGKPTPGLDGLISEEINAIIQYVTHSTTSDNSAHPELHKAILDMHDNFPTWVQQRVAFLDNASREPTKETPRS